MKTTLVNTLADLVLAVPATGACTLLASGIDTCAILHCIASQMPFDPASDPVAITRLATRPMSLLLIRAVA